MPHIHLYAEFAEKVRWTEFKSLPKGIEWQAAKGSRKKNQIYIKKDGDYKQMAEWDDEEEYTIDIELYPWQVALVAILNTEPDDRSIYWIWETKGGVGKTTFQKWVFLKYPGVVVLSGKASDMKNGIMEYQKKNGKLPKVILINIPSCALLRSCSLGRLLSCSLALLSELEAGA